jgi:hypothetical protein
MSITACIPPKSLHGYGAFLRMWDMAAEEWVVMGGTMDLDMPEISRESVETNDDDGDGTVHYMGSPQVDLAETAYEMDFIEAQHVRLLAIVQDPAVYYTCWQIVLNTPQQRYFEWCGYPSKLSGNVPKKELVKSSLSIQPTGGGLRTGQLVAV